MGSFFKRDFEEQMFLGLLLGIMKPFSEKAWLPLEVMVRVEREYYYICYSDRSAFQKKRKLLAEKMEPSSMAGALMSLC